MRRTGGRSDLAGFVLRGLARRPWRSLLSLAAIAIAAASYLLLVALGGSLVKGVQQTVNFLGAELTVQQAGAGLPETSWLEAQQLEGMAEFPGVERLIALVIAVVRMPGNSHFFAFGVGGLPNDVPGLELVRGRRPVAGADELMLGQRAATRLGLGIGRTLEIRGRELAVVGVFAADRGLLDSGAILPLGVAQGVFRTGPRANLAFLMLASGADAGTVAEGLARRFPEIEVARSDIWVSTYRQLDIVDQFARILAAVALLVACLGVSNVLALGVSERRGEIGLLRAIGWRRSTIAATVVGEALGLGLFGGLLGCPLGAAALRLLRLAYDTSGLFAQKIPLSLDLEVVGLCLLAAMLGAGPALALALRIEPAHALRVLG